MTTEQQEHDQDCIDNLMEAMKLIERAMTGPDDEFLKAAWNVCNKRTQDLTATAYRDTTNEVHNRGVWDNDTTAQGNHFCGRCAGTGRFITRVENGKPTGPGGECFRCGGKGHHDAEDRKRNSNWEQYGQRVGP